MSQSGDQNKFNLRLPDGLRDKVRIRAAHARRSMNAEFVKLIEDRIEMLEAYDRIRDRTGGVDDEEISRLSRRLRGGVDGDLSAEVADILASSLSVAPR